MKIVTLVVITALVVVASSILYASQQSTIDDLRRQLSRQQAFAKTPNQACLGLKQVKEMTYSPVISNLVAHQELATANADGLVASFRCTTGQNTKQSVQGQEVAKVDSDGREMGAEVLYFASASQADKYHQTKLNKLRYWSVPNNNLTADVPYFKYFTSYVGKPFYFDAYAVKKNVIVRVTLPCGDSRTSESAIGTCVGSGVDVGAAVSSLKSFTESVAAEPISN